LHASIQRVPLCSVCDAFLELLLIIMEGQHWMSCTSQPGYFCSKIEIK
jgi:hypothetical protein